LAAVTAVFHVQRVDVVNFGEFVEAFVVGVLDSVPDHGRMSMQSP
jgi:hypothetical protein